MQINIKMIDSVAWTMGHQYGVDPQEIARRFIAGNEAVVVEFMDRYKEGLVRIDPLWAYAKQSRCPYARK
jgi:hypothetical protein